MKTARLVLALALAAFPAAADEIPCAVAANFVPCFEEVAAAFEQATGHTVLISSGSTGSLTAQIRQGAPFELFLAADEACPRHLDEEGFTVPGTRRTYAVGRLVLWARRAPDADKPDLLTVLTDPAVAHVALADPRLAPYGRAARQGLEALGVDLGERLVLGRNVAQVWHFVAAGAADAGFVALAQVPVEGPSTGVIIPVPEELHEPIRQQAVLLKEASDAAADLLAFLTTGPGRAILPSYGYGFEASP
jgi:molybdate transport system substrate-binding protein